MGSGLRPWFKATLLMHGVYVTCIVAANLNLAKGSLLSQCRVGGWTLGL